MKRRFRGAAPTALAARHARGIKSDKFLVFLGLGFRVTQKVAQGGDDVLGGKSGVLECSGDERSRTQSLGLMGSGVWVYPKSPRALGIDLKHGQ